MLRAFVDESGSPGREGIFTMGGVIAFNIKWEELILAWDFTLKSGKAIPFFRTANLRSRDWRNLHGLSVNDANEKTEALARLMTYPPLLFSVCCSLDKQDYREVITDRGLHRRDRLCNLWLNTPYAYCLHNTVALVLEKVVNRIGITGDVVDFVFDRNDPLFDSVNAMFRELRQTLSVQGWSETLGDVIQGSPQRTIPLQIADLMAARLKDYCTSRTTEDKNSLLAVSGAGDNNITRHITRSRLEGLATHLERGGAI